MCCVSQLKDCSRIHNGGTTALQLIKAERGPIIDQNPQDQGTMLRLVLALCLSLAAGQPQIFYSEPEGLAFQPAKSPKLIGADGVTAMLSSLLSIPADSLSHETGSQVTMKSSKH